MKAKIFNLVLILGLIFSMAAVPYTADAAVKPAPFLFFVSDGMRPDLMEKYAAEGLMPTYANLMKIGVKGVNGLVQAFPPNTGVGWYTLLTGTYPGEHGSTNNTFFRSGDIFNNRTAAFTDGILQADSLAQAAERAGKTVVAVEWAGARNLIPKLQGPVVDYRNFFSNRGVLVNYDMDGQPAGANAFGVSYQRVDLDPAAGWTNVPVSYSPAMEETLKLTNTAFPATDNVDRFYNMYIFDSTDDAATNYDTVLVVDQVDAKDGAEALAELNAGEWADIKVTLTGARAGQTAGFYLKAIDIAPDLSQFRVYFTSIARSNASYLALGATESAAFEEYLAANFPSSTAGDYAPQEAGIVDDATYMEQALAWKNAHWAYLTYILKDLAVKPDLLLLGNPATDEISHQFLSRTVPNVSGIDNPYFIPEEAERYESYLKAAYEEADATLALGRKLLGGNPTTFASSDHGFGAQWLAVNSNQILFDAGLLANGNGTAVGSNCRAGSGTGAVNLAKSCVAGGTAQIYVNTTLPTGTTYAQVREQVVAAFESLSDPDIPGAQVVLKIMMKEELRDVDGSDSLHPNRSGDVVVVLKPPYQFDAATPGKVIAFSQFFGQHGYLPETVDLDSGVNMHAVFVAGGPGVRKQDPMPGVRAVDLAPTISAMMNIPGPQNARGRILIKLFKDPGRFKEATILTMSDFHGQIIPTSETADNVTGTGTSNASFSIGGSAFLKPWFDVYRAEAALNNSYAVTMFAGDSVGATPPISNFFGDKPTYMLMNAMGVNAEALGNHQFDRGQEYLRSELIPLADFVHVAANAVYPDTLKTPPEWQPTTVFQFSGFKLGVVGYTLPELPTLIFPGYLDPFIITDPVLAVNKEAAKLRAKSINAIVALGHMGFDLPPSTIEAPVGPLVNLANGLKGVDVAIGGHTHTTLVSKANGILLTQTVNAGKRFNRIRVLVDTSTKKVVYKTADTHKPWVIGVTPDAFIQGEIDALNVELGPIFNTVIGESTVAVPRADSCGRGDGRLCESLIGDLATDALRTVYSTDFAITNSGGLRADLTCPTTDNPSDFCPAFTPPPYPITRGSVLGVLPFGNVVFTVSINGAELKSMLENGVSSMPTANGRFPQVSGLCFTYDVSAAVGSRVTSVVRQAADGSCTGAPVDLTAASTYTIAENDFMATGGDGYLNLYARGTTQDLMDEVLADFITANTPVAPSIQGRIVCTGAGCPVQTP